MVRTFISEFISSKLRYYNERFRLYNKGWDDGLEGKKMSQKYKDNDAYVTGHLEGEGKRLYGDKS